MNKNELHIVEGIESLRDIIKLFEDMKIDDPELLKQYQSQILWGAEKLSDIHKYIEDEKQ